MKTNISTSAMLTLVVGTLAALTAAQASSITPDATPRKDIMKACETAGIPVEVTYKFILLNDYRGPVRGTYDLTKGVLDAAKVEKYLNRGTKAPAAAKAVKSVPAKKSSPAKKAVKSTPAKKATPAKAPAKKTATKTLAKAPKTPAAKAPKTSKVTKPLATADAYIADLSDETSNS
jgi:hypothetical protein